MIRVPALETAQVKQFYNGPESFTADNNFIVGPAPGFDNFYVGCGFNSMGIASAAAPARRSPNGSCKASRHWIYGRSIFAASARFNAQRELAARSHQRSARHALQDAVAEPRARKRAAVPALAVVCAAAATPARASGRRWDGNVPNFFAPSREQAQHRILAGGIKTGTAWVADEHRACRERVAIFDMSSFAKLLLQGSASARDALAVAGRQRTTERRPAQRSTRPC